MTFLHLPEGWSYLDLRRAAQAHEDKAKKLREIHQAGSETLDEETRLWIRNEAEQHQKAAEQLRAFARAIDDQ